MSTGGALPDATATGGSAWAGRTAITTESGGVRVVAASRAQSPALRDVRRAVRRVRSVLPGWDGRVTVDVPATEDEYAAALGGRENLDAAAVTVVVRGQLRVVVNPSVFPEQRSWAREAVLTHELVHVATDAVHSQAPGWLTEGSRTTSRCGAGRGPRLACGG
ncbi:MAG: hypothetical protein R2734_15950 [Nocardioides sp.]